MLAAALAMQGDPTAETKLRTAFPNQRKTLDRLVRIAGDLPNFRTVNGESRTGQPERERTSITTKPQPEYLSAARRAINQLGAVADCDELLRRAESIFESTRERPGDIS